MLMLKLGIGTNEVEKYSQVCGSQGVRKKFDRSLVLFAMKKKVQDASWAAEQARIKFLIRKTEYRRIIRENTFIDLEFQQILQYECNAIWLQRKEKNRQKVQFLVDNRQQQVDKETETDIRGIKFRDVDLQEEVNDKNTDVISYGNVEVSHEMAEVLKVNPNMMTFE